MDKLIERRIINTLNGLMEEFQFIDSDLKGQSYNDYCHSQRENFLNILQKYIDEKSLIKVTNEAENKFRTISSVKNTQSIQTFGKNSIAHNTGTVNFS